MRKYIVTGLVVIGLSLSFNFRLEAESFIFNGTDLEDGTWLGTGCNAEASELHTIGGAKTSCKLTFSSKTDYAWPWYQVSTGKEDWSAYKGIKLDIYSEVDVYVKLLFGLRNGEKMIGEGQPLFLKPETMTSIYIPLSLFGEKDSLSNVTTVRFTGSKSRLQKEEIVYINLSLVTEGGEREEVESGYIFDERHWHSVVGGVSYEMSSDYATEDKYSSKVTFQKTVPELELKYRSIVKSKKSGNCMLDDWSDYDEVRLDIYNPEDFPVKISCNFAQPGKAFDALSRLEPKAWNSISISLEGRDVTHITDFRFTILVGNMLKERITLYFDNMRLVKAKILTVSKPELIPDPFSASKVTIKAEINRAADWLINIKDAKGKTIQTYKGDSKNILQVWDGTDREGKAVVDGDFFLTLLINKGEASKNLGKVTINRKKVVGKYALWAEGPLKKIRKDEMPLPLSEEGIKIKSARNEYESFQLVFATQKESIESITLAVSDLRTEEGKLIAKENIKFFKEYYVDIRSLGLFPDALPELKEPFDLKSEDKLQPIWVDIHVPKGTLPGKYKGMINVSAKNALTVQMPLEVSVWDFGLSDRQRLKTPLYAICWYSIRDIYKVERGSPEFKKIFEKYFWFAIEHKITPDGLIEIVEDWTSPEAKKYLDDPRVNWFRVMKHFYSEVTPESKKSIKEYLDFIRKSGWKDKAYICLWGGPYGQDEPYTEEQYKRIVRGMNLCHEIAPDIPYLTTKEPIPIIYNNVDTSSIVWFPATERFDAKKGKERQILGDKIGWYNNATHIQKTAISLRVMGILSALYDMKAWSIWAINFWGRPGESKNVWVDPASYKKGQEGNGFLLYPGKDGPVASIRLKLTRDAIEDYEYLYLLGEKINKVKEELKSNIDCNGRERIEEICRSVATGLRDYKADPTYLYKAREKIAKEILEIEKHPLILVKTDPLENFPTLKREVVITGITEPNTKVIVNGEKVPLEPDFSFKVKLPLKKLINDIVVEASLGEEKKIIQRAILCEEDPNISKLKEIINSAKEKGIKTAFYEEELKKISEQGELEEKNRNLIKRWAKELQNQEINLFTEKLTKGENIKNKRYQDFLNLAQESQKKGRCEMAKYYLNRAEGLDPTKGIEGCSIKKIVHYNRSGYELRNSLLDIVIWQEGGRIIRFERDGIPLLNQAGINNRFTGAGWVGIGGYEDAGQSLFLDSFYDWELKITEESEDTVALSASKIMEVGLIELKREMRIWKNNPGLEIKYTVTNLSNEEREYSWRAHCSPAVGRSLDNQGGNPDKDIFLLPAKEAFQYPRYSREFTASLKCPVDKRMELLSPYAGVFDPEEKAAFFFKLVAPQIKTLYLWYGLKDEYTLEPWLEKVIILPRKSISFTIYLVGYSNIESKEEAIRMVEKHVPKLPQTIIHGDLHPEL